MKLLPFYSEQLNLSSKNAVFKYMLDNILPTNRLWSYFVDWEKILEKKSEYEIALNALNYLLGKKNFDEEFCRLFTQQPNLAFVLPALLVRDGKDSKRLKILTDINARPLQYYEYDFTHKNPTAQQIENYLEFVTKTGLKEILINGHIKNLVDYMIGVEAGINSNARKNRSGTAMETIVETFIESFSKKHNYPYLSQVKTKNIKEEFGYIVNIDTSSRCYDFVIKLPTSLVIIEANYYSSSGSKPASIAREYKTLHDRITQAGHKFIWITDGLGWKAMQDPLKDSFDHIDYLINLKMLENDILDAISV